jgi:hypothetical protein
MHTSNSFVEGQLVGLTAETVGILGQASTSV